MKKKRSFGFILFNFLFVLVLLMIVGSFLYVKFSPKVQINTANSLMMYDLNNDVFF